MRQNEDSYEKEYRIYNTNTFENTEWKANPQEFFLIT